MLLTAFFLALPLHAQDRETITLQEAIDLALENNFQLKQAENNLQLAERSIFNEYADFLPSVSASLSGSSRKGQQLVRQGNSQVFVDNVTNSIGGSIRASLPIFNGFDNILSLRINQADKLSSEERYEWARENVIFNTASRFLQVLLNKQLLEIARENLATSEKQLEQVRAQVEVGSRPTVDLYNQEATVANNELTVTRRENDLQLSKLQLTRQLQIDPQGSYEFVIPNFNPDNASIDPDGSYSVDALIEQAFENRSDLKSEMANVRTLEMQLRQAKYDLFPTLNADASFSSNYSDQYFGGGVSFNDQFFDQNFTQSVGLSLSIPIFSNWNRMFRIQSAQVNYKNAELNLEDTRLQIVQEVTQAYTDYLSFQKELESTQKALRAAEKTFETQRERYEVGAGTLIELSDANAQYVQARANRAQAVFNFIFQQKLLDYYIGKLDDQISITR